MYEQYCWAAQPSLAWEVVEPREVVKTGTRTPVISGHSPTFPFNLQRLLASLPEVGVGNASLELTNH